MSDDEVFEFGRKSIYWMIAGFVIAGLMIAFVLIVVGYQERLTRVPGEMKVVFITQRFMNNPDCFAYQDPSTQRVFPNSIDFSKFTKEQLNKCYQTDEKNGYKTFNFELTLNSKSITLATNNYFKMPKYHREYRVVIWDGQKFETDTLQVNMQESVLYSNLPQGKKIQLDTLKIPDKNSEQLDKLIRK